MSIQRFNVGEEVGLVRAIPAFVDEAAAEELDWTRRRVLPPGRYMILRSGRSGEGLNGEQFSDGYYYEVGGTAGGWVRQNYLLAGQHDEWPHDLTEYLEPCDWTGACEEILRARVGETVSRKRSGCGKGGLAPSDAARCDEPSLDDLGMARARAGSWLPDLDDAFQLEEDGAPPGGPAT